MWVNTISGQNKKGVKDSISQSSNEFEEIFNQSPIGIIFFNKEGNVTNANKSAFEILGIPKLDDILGRNLFDYPLIVEKKEKLFKKGIINFNAPLDLKKLEDYGYYHPTKKEVLFLDYIVSVTDSGFLVQIHDVTEHKKAERELHESEKNFKSILEAFPEGAFLIDAEGNIKIANKTLAKRFDKDLDEIAGLNIYDLLPPEVGKKRKEVVEQAIRTKKPITHVDTRNGLYIKSYVHPILNERREVSNIAVTAEDITMRKKAEIKLRESEAELARAQHIAHIGSYKWNLITNKVKWSDESYRLLGMKPGEAEPNYELFLDLIVPEDRDKVNDAVRRSIETGENYSLTYNVIGKDGTPRILLSENEIIKDEYGNVIKMYGTNQDVTKLKNAEKALKKSEQWFKSIVDTSPSLLVILNKEGKVLYVSPNAEQMTGYTPEEIKENIWIVHPDEKSRLQELFENAFATEEGTKSIEYKSIKKNGGVWWTATTSKPIKDEKGEFKGFVVQLFDITERKKAEEELRHAHDNLEIKVKERTKELEEAITELESSNEELQSFAFITSHDLQEPLRTMGNYAGLLKMRYSGQLDEDANDFLDYMASGAARMKDMIQGLLDYSRIGSQEGELNEFNSADALNEALTNLKSSIEECKVEVTYDSLPIIFADENQITRVFQNLIGNALKFSREGIKPKIHISARKEGSEYVFCVQDNGIGIEEQYTDHIFEVFKRLYAVGEYKGVGIGLAIVKRIIDHHGGRVWVESEFGVGSTFYFTVPIGK